MFTTVVKWFLQTSEPCLPILYPVDPAVSPSTDSLHGPTQPPLSVRTCSQETVPCYFCASDDTRWCVLPQKTRTAPTVAKPLVHQNHAHGLLDIFDFLQKSLEVQMIFDTGAKSPVAFSGHRTPIICVRNSLKQFNVLNLLFHPKTATFI